MSPDFLLHDVNIECKVRSPVAAIHAIDPWRADRGHQGCRLLTVSSPLLLASPQPQLLPLSLRTRSQYQPTMAGKTSRRVSWESRPAITEDRLFREVGGAKGSSTDDADGWGLQAFEGRGGDRRSRQRAWRELGGGGRAEVVPQGHMMPAVFHLLVPRNLHAESSRTCREDARASLLSCARLDRAATPLAAKKEASAGEKKTVVC